jgi:proteasome lid subunit RPN8/RPN11
MIRYPVNIPPRVLAGMRRHAVACVPAECCGALIGQAAGDRIDLRGLIPLENEATEPDRYRIGAATVLRLDRQAACAGLQLVGFYHSHPSCDASPSPKDLELASPGFIYMIVPSEGAVRGWRLRDDRAGFDELSLELLAGAA